MVECSTTPNWIRIIAMVLIQLWMAVYFLYFFFEPFSINSFCIAFSGLIIGLACTLILYRRKQNIDTLLMIQSGLAVLIIGQLFTIYEHYDKQMLHKIYFYLLAFGLAANLYGIVTLLAQHIKKLHLQTTNKSS